MARSTRVRYKKPDGSFAFMGRRKYKMMQDAKKRASKNPVMQNLLSQMGITGPGNPGNPGINPPGPPPVGINPPGPPPVGINPPGPPPATGGPRVSNPDTFFGGQQPTQQAGGPQLDLGPVKGGAIGAAPQDAQPPTMKQTIQQQQFAKQQQGGDAASGTGGTPSATQTAAPSGINNNLNASSNKTPAISTPNYGTGNQFGTSGLGQGVTTGQLQGAVTGSSILNTGPATAGQIQQAQYNPLINMAGKTDIMNQLSTPGRSNVGGQYGTGGLVNIAQQTAANQAAMQGNQGAQQLIGGNLQQQLGAQQLASQFDLAGRQQNIQHLNAMLQPATAGVASGFGQAIQGMNKMPQFLG